MTSDTDLRERCRAASGIETDSEVDPTAMIGFFQRFRPDGRGLEGLYEGLAHGDQYHERLDHLFEAAGDDRRPTGGRDAYFVVRQPPPMSPEAAEFNATRWMEGLQKISARSGNAELSKQLETRPRIRILEGSPPKQPKADQESFPLLKAIKVHAASMTDGLASGCQVVSLLREAYYFTACDSMVRDYLLWPAYEEALGEADPMAGYFELWRHGIKLRVFHDDMIDLYLPR